MKIDDIVKLLSDSSGKHCYSIYIPTLKRELEFMPLTVGAKKSLSKLAMDDNDNLYNTLTAMIIQSCTEEIDLCELTEVDRIYILAHIYCSNFPTVPKYKITCSECDTEFIAEISPVELVKDLRDVDFPVNVIPFVNDDFKCDLAIGMPSINTNVHYNNYIKEIKRIVAIENKEYLDRIDEYLSKYAILAFIKDISINDKKVDNYDDLTMEERNEIIDLLPAQILNQITDYVVEHELGEIVKRFAYVRECIKCKKKVEVIFTISDFFQL